MIASARQRVLLRNPYAVRLKALGALAEAARRGAEVRAVMADDHNDSVVHQSYARSWYPWLHAAGVDLHEHRHHFSHTKALTVDGQRSLVGSFNYNNRSASLDFECGLVIDDRIFAAELERRLYDDDLDAGVLQRRDDRLTAAEEVAIPPCLAAFELWGTFL